MPLRHPTCQRLGTLVALACALACLTFPAKARAAGVLGPRLQRTLDKVDPSQDITVWIRLTDKGPLQHSKAWVPTDFVSQRSLERRLKVRPGEKVIDSADLPVASPYTEAIEERVARLRQRSRWFNAVSVEATPEQIRNLLALPFVREIELVGRFHRREPEVDQSAPVSPRLPEARKATAFNYGPSFGQLDQIEVTSLHNMGLTGEGILIGHFDNGHRLLEHEVFASMEIVATWDFVDMDPDPAPNLEDPTSYGAHGVATLSVLGGFKEGEVIGPAFGASFILARTENDASETPLEEDNWVAAIEWADSIGVDVVSTSLGYLTYNAPFSSWGWEDMDGNTTVITRASDMAVARGIVVVNSAGNAGFNPEHNTLIAPADGDSVISAGSVTSDGSRSAFSSVGPTTDGRFKPDVMAQGSSVRYASAADTTAYSNGSGTSFSCPLVAGVAALLLAAHPQATPLEIGDALRLTATQSHAPDNLMGWGIVRASSALEYLDSISDSDLGFIPPRYRLSRNFPNPFNPGTTLRYDLPVESRVQLQIFDARGRLVRVLFSGSQVAAAHTIQWDGRSDSGATMSSGTYFVRMRARSLDGRETLFSTTRKLSLVR